MSKPRSLRITIKARNDMSSRPVRLSIHPAEASADDAKICRHSFGFNLPVMGDRASTLVRQRGRAGVCLRIDNARDKSG